METVEFVAVLAGVPLVFLVSIIWSIMIAWRRRCPECGEKFIIPEAHRKRHYRRNLIYEFFHLIGKAFPSLSRPSAETDRQTGIVMWLCIAAICITVLGFWLLDGWIMVKLVREYGGEYTSHRPAPAWQISIIALLIAVIVVGLRYSLRRYAIAPLILTVVLFALIISGSITLNGPAMYGDMMGRLGGGHDTVANWREMGKGSRAECMILRSLNGKSAKVRAALVELLPNHMKPWMKEQILGVAAEEQDPNIQKRLKELAGRLENSSE